MITKSDLFKALLALDSYNQGYGRGLLHGLTEIGQATLLGPSNGVPAGKQAEWEAAGFYAAAYRLEDGTTVISGKRKGDASLCLILNPIGGC